MKLRSDFVTNSSSSSFVAIATKGRLNQLKDFVTYAREAGVNVPYTAGWDDEEECERGETEFGWGIQVYDDVNSKLNYLVMQCGYDQQKLERLKRVFHDCTGMDLDVSYLLNEKKKDDDDDEERFNNLCYIDHQSVSGDILDTIFTTDGTLTQFLFNDASVVIQGNDNRDNDFDNMEKRYTDANHIVVTSL